MKQMALLAAAVALLLACAPAYAAPCPKDSAGQPCSQCKAAVAKSKWADSAEAEDMIKKCYQCATKNPGEAYPCYTCLTTSKSGVSGSDALGIATRCLTCITKDKNPGWACTQYCAATAKSTSEMSTCSACLMSGKHGINTWGCFNCMQRGPDTPKKTTCMQQCVEKGYDSWACGECAASKKHGSDEAIQTCYKCLSDKKKNTYDCINPK